MFMKPTDNIRQKNSIDWTNGIERPGRIDRTGSKGWSNQNISIFLPETGINLPTHWHDAIEIIYLPKGHAVLTSDGTRRTIYGRNFFVIESGQLHDFFCPWGCSPLMIHVDEAYLASFTGKRRDYRFFCTPEEIACRTAVCKDPLSSYGTGLSSCGTVFPDSMSCFYNGVQARPGSMLCGMFDELACLLKTCPHGSGLLIESMILYILFILVNRFSVPLCAEELSESKDLLRIRDILSCIYEYYDRPIGLEEISDHFGLSCEYFSRLFTKAVGISFKKYLNQIRLAHIYDDLCTSDAPIMELSLRHGFTNYKLFTRLFREMYGATPREFRNRLSPD